MWNLSDIRWPPDQAPGIPLTPALAVREVVSAVPSFGSWPRVAVRRTATTDQPVSPFLGGAAHR